jgi:hypothetical protein
LVSLGGEMAHKEVGMTMITTLLLARCHLRVAKKKLR